MKGVFFFTNNIDCRAYAMKCVCVFVRLVFPIEEDFNVAFRWNWCVIFYWNKIFEAVTVYQWRAHEKNQQTKKKKK